MAKLNPCGRHHTAHTAYNIYSSAFYRKEFTEPESRENTGSPVHMCAWACKSESGPSPCPPSRCTESHGSRWMNEWMNEMRNGVPHCSEIFFTLSQASRGYDNCWEMKARVLERKVDFRCYSPWLITVNHNRCTQDMWWDLVGWTGARREPVVFLFVLRPRTQPRTQEILSQHRWQEWKAAPALIHSWD